jgi:hypothetical protein
LRAVGRDEFLADDAEGSRILEVQSGLKKIRMVENVKEIGGGFDFVALAERGALSEARVERVNSGGVGNASGRSIFQQESRTAFEFVSDSG